MSRWSNLIDVAKRPPCPSTPTVTLAPSPGRAQPLWIGLRGGPRVPLRGLLRIGSDRGCTLVVDDPYVSAHHAEVHLQDGHAMLVDLGSKNGTWLDEVRIDACPWVPGVRVRVGRTLLELVDAAGVDAGASAATGDPARALGSASERNAAAMVGSGPAFTAMTAALRRVAATKRPVLLLGETGAGKELAAEYLHRHSPRATRPLVALSCATIVDSLAESQLFGHARGAFTGALRAHAGAFVRADGGTLFLDEIGELPLLQQAKLLRVLETSRVQPIGSELEQSIDVRVICATHRDLPSMVAAGRFREDLYHRLGVLMVRVPPLRERREDIDGLLTYFARDAARELGRAVEFAAGVRQLAARHPWPGNIRALRNAVVRAAAMDDGPITAEALLPPPELPSLTSIAHDAPRLLATLAPARPRRRLDRATLAQLVEHHGSIRRAALALGIPRSTLGARLRRGDDGPAVHAVHSPADAAAACSTAAATPTGAPLPGTADPASTAHDDDGERG
ncbi:MAG: sigma 54-interacting transcriptional regulator [Deltaproteobacteria bacterium]|nr:sigma 54-interacting transcriptional regulator [Deltaproteobacteria bacterium]MBK8236954.1 sigma 54-interacting transcriptional regulator [Deltaproteobacteria bacterium]MBP7289796.1 sigma 54-interacting transcriptional regulator [Nannocystaceae bacterium]